MCYNKAVMSCVSYESFKDISNMFLKVFQASFRKVDRLCQECFKGSSRKFCLKNVPMGKFLSVSRKF